MHQVWWEDLRAARCQDTGAWKATPNPENTGALTAAIAMDVDMEALGSQSPQSSKEPREQPDGWRWVDLRWMPCRLRHH